MQLSRNLFPHEFRHSLDVLARKFALPMPEGRHRALADAVLAAQALQKMLETGNVRSMDQLRKLASIRQLVG
jgi:DNA polymerase III epsilon subunit-like protein